ncbi:hypothetical protein WJX72_007759 [[Myrmecia] bisecta]|uniref:RNB domain-containing protein n=1 Tax=[Myrmecia] bisecta TaxID=41462 RepID=A0AAW1R868_9CHLO
MDHFLTWRTSQELRPGALVEFQKDSRTALGLLQRPDGKRNWVVVDHRGNPHSLRPAQFSYVLPGRGYKEADMVAVQERVEQEADASLLQDAWEMVLEDNTMFTTEQMADFIFGSVEPWACYAAHRLLTEDRLYFKQAGRSPPVFQARPEKDVRSMIAKQEADRKLAEEAALWLDSVQQAQKLPYDQKPTAEVWHTGQFAERVRLLVDFALEAFMAPQHKAAAVALLQALGIHASPNSAADLLIGMGIWRPHEQVSLIRAGLTETFPPECQAEVEQVGQRPPPDADAAHRLDLRHHTVYTIDDASTTEIDDGLSVERLGEGRVRLWVHIADPTRWVPLHTPLDLEAQRRTKTLYLATGSIPMFPRALSDGLFSLRQGQDCCSMSVGVILAPDGSIAEQKLSTSRIRPAQRLTYDAVDEMLAGGDAASEDMQLLAQAAELRQQWREEAGAVQFNLPEMALRVADAHSDAPAVSISVLDQLASPARRLVQELMILAGEAVANFGAEQGVPLPYRGQNAAVLPTAEELNAVPEGPCRAVMLRMRMTRSVGSTAAPVPHAALGLPGYVQFSSPIRRYGDLLAHYQVKAQLRGEAPPFDVDTLEVLMEATNRVSRDFTGLEREVESYWVAHYFHHIRTTAPKQTWPALFLVWVRQDLGLARVLLEDLGLETVTRINRPLMPGERLQLACTFVDVRNGLFRLEEPFGSQAPQADAPGLGGYGSAPGDLDLHRLSGMMEDGDSEAGSSETVYVGSENEDGESAAQA